MKSRIGRRVTRRHGFRRQPLRGVTVIELIIAYCVIAAVIWLLVGVSRHVRDRAKQEQAVQLMQALSDAMQAYQKQSQGAYPPVRTDGDAAGCLQTLAAFPPSREVLSDRLPDRWRAMLGEAREWPDPWGTPLRYVRGTTRGRAGEAVAIPYLESAGKDGQFGDTSNAGLIRTTDNLRTDEPMGSGE